MFFLVDKPGGFTSFDIVQKLKRLYPGEKIGHAGTLDPMATGLLIVAIGKDTKKLDHFLHLDKTYEATIDFSKNSDTRDAEYRSYYEEYPVDDHGITKDGKQVAAPSLAALQAVLDSGVWTHLFPLTPFSAKKIQGKKLYEYARAGTPIFMDIPMTIRSYTIISYAFPLLTVHLDVASGTYIRSIAHRLGSKVGMWGILVALRRCSIGTYQL